MKKALKDCLRFYIMYLKNNIELFDVYDANKQKTGKIIKRGERLKKDEFKIFVQVWLKDENNRILLEKRTANVTSPHLWCAVGGHLKSGEDALTACIRETMEEVGIDVRKFKGGYLEERKYYLDDQSYFCDTFVFFISSTLSFKIQKKEVEKVAFFTFDELREEMKKGNTFTYWLDYLEKIEKANINSKY